MVNRPIDDLPLETHGADTPRELPPDNPDTPAVPVAAIPELIETAAPNFQTWLPVLERGLTIAEKFIEAFNDGRAARAQRVVESALPCRH